MARRRRRLGRGRSRRMFSSTAGHQKVHRRNMMPIPMRGGIRL